MATVSPANVTTGLADRPAERTEVREDGREPGRGGENGEFKKPVVDIYSGM